MIDPRGGRPVLRETYGTPVPAGREPANLGDILERVLDRGVVIAGDIRVNLLDIELLTIKLRLLVASVDTAREMGIDWWEHDSWLTGKNHELIDENRRLRERLAAVEEVLALNRPADAKGDTAEQRPSGRQERARGGRDRD
ncbi:gas vesicle protein [Planotetraspora sp. A-T 1434]|uniref:gas vesicle protein GvpJ n=1 Tax=Planotetraspora sp. A-T 1434 TaxID=2979219 RepID=UPI0021C0232C|nr:gas vesicle protein GvpJ [Planotetraspora sp. A-T 1434]MCT9933971.1 gas vesicle protein [Planotetraspora sp. A-T 1434]